MKIKLIELSDYGSYAVIKDIIKKEDKNKFIGTIINGSCIKSNSILGLNIPLVRYYNDYSLQTDSIHQKICNELDEYIVKGDGIYINGDDYIFSVKDQTSNLKLQENFYRPKWLEENRYNIRKKYFENYFKYFFNTEDNYLDNKHISFYFRFTNNIRNDISFPIIDDENYICKDIYVRIDGIEYIPLSTFLLFSFDYNVFPNFILDYFLLCNFINDNDEMEILINNHSIGSIKENFKKLENIDFSNSDVSDEINYYFSLDNVKKFIELDKFKYIDGDIN